MSRTLIALSIAGSVVVGLPAAAAAPVDMSIGLSHMATAHTFPIRVDGSFRGETQWAVKAFQAKVGLKVDGLAGPATLKALGLKGDRTLRMGDDAYAVRALQVALNARAAKPQVRPGATPAPAPTPSILWTPAPTPGPTEESTLLPTSEPWTPAPTVEPSPGVLRENHRTTLELMGGAWMLPLTPGGSDYDYGFTRPTYQGLASAWVGDWGVGGGATVIPAGAIAAGSPLTNLYDAQIRWRGPQGYGSLGLGWRGIQTQTVGAKVDDYLALSAGLRLPIVGNTLQLHLLGLGGYGLGNFGLPHQQSGWTADGMASLGLHLGPVGILGGWRYMVLNAPTGHSTWQGPTANVTLGF